MTVAKNVAYGLERESCRGPKIRRRVSEVLEKVGLDAMAARKPQQLSGGQRQRVALARAIVEAAAPAAAGRAAVGAGQEGARGDAAGAQAAPERGRHHLRRGHPRPGGGHVAGRPDRGLQRGQGPAGGRAGGAVRAPAHPFVAGFVGANNLFSGRACSVGLASDRARGAPGVSNLPDGTPALLAVRPERLRLDGMGVCAETSSTSASTAASRTSRFGWPGARRRSWWPRRGPPRSRRDLRWHSPGRAGDGVLIPRETS